MRPSLQHIDAWIFDLDNTLYPASAALFPLIDQRMTTFVGEQLGLPRDQAFALQKQWFLEHGTTLSGMMAQHGVDPHAFLDFVHDIDMSALSPDEKLAGAIALLPGRKLVFTNGDEPYARRVLGRLGLADTFEAIHDIHATAYQPKPHPAAYEGLCAAYAIDPKRALFAEDMARNLKPAKTLGMTTLWVDNGSEQGHDADRSFIDYTTPDLGHWLLGVLEEE
jgi:putative hydrolase of the HAD superfamily